jgi:uncharacterized protein YjbJ (UPF0337 family)
MNRDQFSGKWHELKGKVKEKWGRLTDDDITRINGKWEQLAGKLQQRYGWAKEQADREITTWCTHCEQNKGHKEEHRNTQTNCGPCKTEHNNPQQVRTHGQHDKKNFRNNEDKKRKAS